MLFLNRMERGDGLAIEQGRGGRHGEFFVVWWTKRVAVLVQAPSVMLRISLDMNDSHSASCSRVTNSLALWACVMLPGPQTMDGMPNC